MRPQKKKQHDDRRVGDTIGNEVFSQWEMTDSSSTLVQIKHLSTTEGIRGIQLVWEDKNGERHHS